MTAFPQGGWFKVTRAFTIYVQPRLRAATQRVLGAVRHFCQGREDFCISGSLIADFLNRHAAPGQRPVDRRHVLLELRVLAELAVIALEGSRHKRRTVRFLDDCNEMLRRLETRGADRTPSSTLELPFDDDDAPSESGQGFTGDALETVDRAPDFDVPGCDHGGSQTCDPRGSQPRGVLLSGARSKALDPFPSVGDAPPRAVEQGGSEGSSGAKPTGAVAAAPVAIVVPIGDTDHPRTTIEPVDAQATAVLTDTPQNLIDPQLVLLLGAALAELPPDFHQLPVAEALGAMQAGYAARTVALKWLLPLLRTQRFSADELLAYLADVAEGLPSLGGAACLPYLAFRPEKIGPWLKQHRQRAQLARHQATLAPLIPAAAPTRIGVPRRVMAPPLPPPAGVSFARQLDAAGRRPVRRSA